MKYFLDTNIISYILNGNADVKSQIEKLILNGDEFSIPIFSYYEIKEAYLLPMQLQNLCFSTIL